MRISFKEVVRDFNPFFTLDEFIDHNVDNCCDMFNMKMDGNIYNMDFDEIYCIEDDLLEKMVELYRLRLWDNK